MQLLPVAWGDWCVRCQAFYKTGAFEILKQPKSEEMSYYLLESPEGA